MTDSIQSNEQLTSKQEDEFDNKMRDKIKEDRRGLEIELSIASKRIRGSKNNIKFLEEYLHSNQELLGVEDYARVAGDVKELKAELADDEFLLEKLEEEALMVSLFEQYELDKNQQESFKIFLEKVGRGKLEEAKETLRKNDLLFVEKTPDAQELMKIYILRYWEGQNDSSKKGVLDYISMWRVYFSEIQDMIETGAVKEELIEKYNK